MKKLHIGVLGVYRGSSMINYCKRAENADVVAICDKSAEALEEHKKKSVGCNIAYYDDFDRFIEHDMDAVVLANYANEHAPFAIKALNRGKHVFSEVLPVQNMKEAVELIEAVEKTGLVYAYGENYCYMPSPREMKRLYKEGKIGEFEYGECEYIHNCESIWPSITYGDKNHWRNNMYSTYYCTHSLGPIIHITGLRPVSVTGFEGTKNERNLRTGAKGGQFAVEMVTLENGGIIKSIHGGLYEDSVWYCVYGSKGRMECSREDAQTGHVNHIYVKCDEYSGAYNPKIESYDVPNKLGEKVEGFGHGGSDYYSMYNFIEKISGNSRADTIDVYEAMDMCLPGMFAYRSILNGGMPVDIPDLRNKSVRDKWRNDTACTDPKAAGDMLLPVFSKGTPEIDDGVYDYIKELWENEIAGGKGYRADAFDQGSGKKN